MNWLYLPLTIAIYLLALRLYRLVKTPWLNPLLVTLVALCSLLLAMDVSYQHYQQQAHWLSDLLQLAVVALGVPLYQQMTALRRKLPAIMLLLLIATLLAVSGSLLLGLLIGAGQEIALSLAPKSVTTPVAVIISQQIGGQPALSALAVIVTGIVGAISGPWWMRWLKIESAAAQGLAMGTACHALGTARILEEGAEQGAYSALAMVVSAALTAVIAPLLVPLLPGLLG